ncbi:MAG: deoxyribonuclease IV [Mycobacteriales bacterium]
MVPIGAHLDHADPVAATMALDADAVQFFLTAPQAWEDPKPRADAEAITSSGLAVLIHAPYRINIATTNNRIRIPSRKLLATHAAGAAAIGARGIVVHGGHVGTGEDAAIGFANWRKFFERAQFPLPILIENTAGGDNAMARTFDRLAMLWDAVGEFGAGFCLDTCHAWAAGEELDGIVDRVKAITGRIDLVHANGSRDEFGSSRDRHDNYTTSKLDAQLIAHVVREAQAPVIIETPDDGYPDDLAFLREALA